MCFPSMRKQSCDQSYGSAPQLVSVRASRLASTEPSTVPRRRRWLSLCAVTIVLSLHVLVQGEIFRGALYKRGEEEWTRPSSSCAGQPCNHGHAAEDEARGEAAARRDGGRPALDEADEGRGPDLAVGDKVIK
jgi:hypothetical protein